MAVLRSIGVVGRASKTRIALPRTRINCRRKRGHPMLGSLPIRCRASVDASGQAENRELHIGPDKIRPFRTTAVTVRPRREGRQDK